MLIESGSHVPGVDPARFVLPDYAAVRYEIPAPALAGLVSDYHVLDSEPRADAPANGWMLPNSPAIRFIPHRSPMTLAIGTADRTPLPGAAFYGATSKAARMVVARGGVTIGFNLTPVGFARLLDADASKLRDKVTPLERLLAPAWVDALARRLRDHDRGRAVKAILDEMLPALFAVPHRQETQIRQVADLLARPSVTDLRAEAAAIGIPQRRLERLANRYFGYPPKLLLNRARFLRSIMALKIAGPPYALNDPDYHDDSHFIRNGHRFLGMTPLQFLRMETTYLDSVLRARSIVHGAALAALADGSARA